MIKFLFQSFICVTFLHKICVFKSIARANSGQSGFALSRVGATHRRHALTSSRLAMTAFGCEF